MSHVSHFKWLQDTEQKRKAEQTMCVSLFHLPGPDRWQSLQRGKESICKPFTNLSACKNAMAQDLLPTFTSSNLKCSHLGKLSSLPACYHVGRIKERFRIFLGKVFSVTVTVSAESDIKNNRSVSGALRSTPPSSGLTLPHSFQPDRTFAVLYDGLHVVQG